MKHYWVKKAIHAVLILGLSISGSGCLLTLLSGGSSQFEASTPKYPKTNKAAYCPRARIYTVRGFLDVFSTGMIDLAGKIDRELGIPAQSISHMEEKQLSAFLIKRYESDTYRCRTPIVLIGHSYGADDEITLARRLNKAHIPVALIINLDHTKEQTIPSNVKSFYNLSSGGAAAHAIVPWGCPMKAESPRTKMVQVDLLKNKHIARVNHFNIDKLPEVQAYIIQILKSEHIGAQN